MGVFAPSARPDVLSDNSPEAFAIIEERNRVKEALFAHRDPVEVSREKLFLDEEDYENEDYHEKDRFTQDMLLRVQQELFYFQQFAPREAEELKLYIEGPLYAQWTQEHKANYCSTTIDTAVKSIESVLKIEEVDYENEAFHNKDTFMKAMQERSTPFLQGMGEKMRAKVLEKLQPIFEQRYAQWTQEHKANYCSTTIDTAVKSIESVLKIEEVDYENEAFHNKDTFMKAMQERSTPFLQGMGEKMRAKVLEKLQPIFEQRYAQWTQEHKANYCSTTIDTAVKSIESVLKIEEVDYENEAFHNKDTFMKAMQERSTPFLQGMGEKMRAKVLEKLQPIFEQRYAQWTQEHKANYCSTTIDTAVKSIESVLKIEEVDYENEAFHNKDTFMKAMQERSTPFLQGMGEKMRAKVLEKLQPIFEQRYAQWTQEHKANYCSTTIDTAVKSIESVLKIEEVDYENEAFHNKDTFMKAMQERSTPFLQGMGEKMRAKVLEKLQPIFEQRYAQWTQEHKANYCSTTIDTAVKSIESVLKIEEVDYENEAFHNKDTFMKAMQERSTPFLQGMGEKMRAKVLEKLQPIFEQRYAQWTQEHKANYCSTTIDTAVKSIESVLKIEEVDYENEAFHNKDTFMKAMQERSTPFLQGMGEKMRAKVLEKLQPIFEQRYAQWTQEHKANYCSTTIDTAVKSIESVLKIEEVDYENEAFHNKDTFMKAMQERSTPFLQGMGEKMRAKVLEKLQPTFQALHGQWQVRFNAIQAEKEKLEEAKKKEEEAKKKEEEAAAAKEKAEQEAKEKEEAEKALAEKEEKEAEEARLKEEEAKEAEALKAEQDLKDQEMKEEVAAEVAAAEAAIDEAISSVEVDAPDAGVDFGDQDFDADSSFDNEAIAYLDSILTSDIPDREKFNPFKKAIGAMKVVPLALMKALKSNDVDELRTMFSTLVDQPTTEVKKASFSGGGSVNGVSKLARLLGLTSDVSAKTISSADPSAMESGADLPGDLAVEAEEKTEYTFVLEPEMKEWLRLKGWDKKEVLFDLTQELFDLILVRKPFFKKGEPLGMDWLKIQDRELFDGFAKFFETVQKKPDEFFMMLCTTWSKPEHNFLFGHFMPEEDELPSAIGQQEEVVGMSESEVKATAAATKDKTIEPKSSLPKEDVFLVQSEVPMEVEKSVVVEDVQDADFSALNDNEMMSEPFDLVAEGDLMEVREVADLPEDDLESDDLLIDEEILLSDDELDVDDSIEDVDLDTLFEHDLDEPVEFSDDVDGAVEIPEPEIEPVDLEVESPADLDDEIAEVIEEDFLNQEASFQAMVLEMMDEVDNLEEFNERLQQSEVLLAWIDLMKRRYGLEEKVLYFWLKKHVAVENKESSDEHEVMAATQDHEVDIEAQLPLSDIVQLLQRNLNAAHCQLLWNIEDESPDSVYAFSQKSFDQFQHDIQVKVSPHQLYFFELKVSSSVAHIHVRSVASHMSLFGVKPKCLFHFPLRRRLARAA